MAKRDKKGPRLVTASEGSSGGSSGGDAPAAPPPPPARPGPAPADPRLAQALATFKRGDYVQARALLEPLIADRSLAEGERKQAAALLGATRLDSAMPRTALASAALLILVVVLTAVFQP